MNSSSNSYTSPMKKSQADRFISQRREGQENDPAAIFETKSELFSTPSPPKSTDLNQNNRRNSQSNNQTAEKMEIDDDQQKSNYTALLQNQVLNIENRYLLNEIHNSDEKYQSKDQYAQMQRDAEMMSDVTWFSDGTPTKEQQSSQHQHIGSGLNSDTSPFKSRYTVLKFSDHTEAKNDQAQHSMNFTSPLKCSDQNKTSNSASKATGSTSQSFSQMMGNSSENQNPALSQIGNHLIGGHSNTQDQFQQSQFLGFDEDKIIVPQSSQRQISKTPYKVLDAPGLQDDYYLNLIDWSVQNSLAVVLCDSVYVWSSTTNQVIKIVDFSKQDNSNITQGDSPTSVCWSTKGTHLSVGTNSGKVHVYDVEKKKLVRQMDGHSDRVGSLAWSSGILSSGSRDRNIINRDMRVKDDFHSKLVGHQQEVCGLKWSFDEQQLASGGNDNKVLIWSNQITGGQVEPILKLKGHRAAVKALAWSPHQHGLLATGGGTQDRTIRFWNTNKLQSQDHHELQTIDTGSQVCNLMFSKNSNELVSTHGYSENAVVVWKYPTMKKVSVLKGHQSRVLYLGMDQTGENIVTGAGDETLRFWKVFPGKKNADQDGQNSSLLKDNSNFVIR